MSKAIRRGLYGKLAGDSTLNNLLATPASGYSKSIYFENAPENAHYPMVVFQKQSATPTEAFTAPTAFETEVWLFKAIDRNTSADVAEDILSRIQSLLNDPSGVSISGGTLLYMRRESDVDYSEVVDGEVFRHSGSLFRVITV